MKQLIVAFSIILLLMNPATAQRKSVEDKRFVGLDTAFARILKDWRAAGFAVAVVEKNKVIYSRGFGYKNIESQQPVTPNTQFAIGSCTKAFTSSLLGLLEKDGKLKLDEAATTYIPKLKFHNDNMNAHITIRDLMTHRTGLPRYDYSWYYFPTASRDSIVQRIRFMEPTADIRQSYQYNNFMFLLQGVIAEKLTGKSWEENIRTKIFEPLGMTNSNTTLAEWMKATDIATGYQLVNDTLIKRTEYFDISAMGPAGSINSSVNDMAKWVMLWISGGKYNGHEILPAQYVSQAISSQIAIPGGLPSDKHPDNYINTYGLGWGISSYRGHYRVEHGGNIDGFTTTTCFFPADSIGIIVLANQNGSYVPSLVRNIIADRMLGVKRHDWHAEYFKIHTDGLREQHEGLKTRVSDRKLNTHPSLPLQNYEGLYSSKAGETLLIDLVGDSLIATLPREKFFVSHYHYDVFETYPIVKGVADTSQHGGAKTSFQMDMKGNIASLTVMFDGMTPTVFTRTDKPKKLATQDLEKYVGTYQLGTMEVKVYIKDALYVFLPGQPEYELVPVGGNKFNIKILQGYSVLFDLDGSGSVKAVNFIQPNGNFKAEKKK